jgi:sulfur relay protein TusB/DsrH
MLYLLGDKMLGAVGLQYAQMDADAVVVLIKDGVYLDTQTVQDKKIYAIDEDVKRRGMEGRLKDKAEIVGYDKLVDLVLENKVANFV